MTHDQNTQHLLRRVAALNALAAVVTSELKDAKADLGTEVVRGTMYVLADPDDPQSPVLGSFTMSKPRQAAPRVIDEELAISWVIGEFGADGMIEHRLSEQGRQSVLAAVKAGKSVPGVEIPDPGQPVASFRQDADAKAEVIAMWQRGDLNLATITALAALTEGADQ